jgi:uncharacterized protein involved in high-affinity Fe2+ transport
LVSLSDRDAAYLRHITLKRNAAIVDEDAFCEDRKADPFIGILADQGPHLGLNLELDIAAHNLPHVFVFDNFHEKEVRHHIRHLVEWRRASDAAFPRP